MVKKNSLRGKEIQQEALIPPPDPSQPNVSAEKRFMVNFIEELGKAVETREGLCELFELECTDIYKNASNYVKTRIPPEDDKKAKYRQWTAGGAANFLPANHPDVLHLAKVRDLQKLLEEQAEFFTIVTAPDGRVLVATAAAYENGLVVVDKSGKVNVAGESVTARWRTWREKILGLNPDDSAMIKSAANAWKRKQEQQQGTTTKGGNKVRRPSRSGTTSSRSGRSRSRSRRSRDRRTSLSRPRGNNRGRGRSVSRPRERANYRGGGGPRGPSKMRSRGRGDRGRSRGRSRSRAGERGDNRGGGSRREPSKVRNRDRGVLDAGNKNNSSSKKAPAGGKTLAEVNAESTSSGGMITSAAKSKNALMAKAGAPGAGDKSTTNPFSTTKDQHAIVPVEDNPADAYDWGLDDDDEDEAETLMKMNEKQNTGKSKKAAQANTSRGAGTSKQDPKNVNQDQENFSVQVEHGVVDAPAEPQEEKEWNPFADNNDLIVPVDEEEIVDDDEEIELPDAYNIEEPPPPKVEALEDDVASSKIMDEKPKKSKLTVTNGGKQEVIVLDDDYLSNYKGKDKEGGQDTKTKTASKQNTTAGKDEKSKSGRGGAEGRRDNDKEQNSVLNRSKEERIREQREKYEKRRHDKAATSTTKPAGVETSRHDRNKDQNQRDEVAGNDRGKSTARTRDPRVPLPQALFTSQNKSQNHGTGGTTLSAGDKVGSLTVAAVGGGGITGGRGDQHHRGNQYNQNAGNNKYQQGGGVGGAQMNSGLHHSNLNSVVDNRNSATSFQQQQQEHQAQPGTTGSPVATTTNQPALPISTSQLQQLQLQQLQAMQLLQQQSSLNPNATAEQLQQQLQMQQLMMQNQVMLQKLTSGGMMMNNQNEQMNSSTPSVPTIGGSAAGGAAPAASPPGTSGLRPLQIPGNNFATGGAGTAGNMNSKQMNDDQNNQSLSNHRTGPGNRNFSNNNSGQIKGGANNLFQNTNRRAGKHDAAADSKHENSWEQTQGGNQKNWENKKGAPGGGSNYTSKKGSSGGGGKNKASSKGGGGTVRMR
ncbi:unnamed protein product [Amoebophrya sp. A120]|nr:unnamed protein product [Amoebophrya sp. A120]|eukprot:GSA120T00009519001.1